MVAAVKDYRLILTMPDNMSLERRTLLSMYGAEIMLTPGDEAMGGAVRLAERLAREKGYFLPQQFANSANPEAHRRTTSQEILEQTGGQLDAFVAGVGTGGTVTGVGEVLKEVLPNILVVAVEPEGSAVLSGRRPGPHALQGLGAGFIPSILDREIIDQVVPVSDEDALVTTKRLAQEEGILAGISSGAAVFAALELAHRLGVGKRIVVILPDTGERYLSAFQAARILG
jgi:cysteine synthase A